MGKTQERIIKARDIQTYLQLKKEGWRTAWSGEGKICMTKPYNALAIDPPLASRVPCPYCRARRGHWCRRNGRSMMGKWHGSRLTRASKEFKVGKYAKQTKT